MYGNLFQVLDSPNAELEHSQAAIEGFKADIHKRWNEKTEEQKRRELVCIYKLDL